jgi:hypothetical protein
VRAAQQHLQGLLPQLAKAAGLRKAEYVTIQHQGEYLVELPADRRDVPQGWEKVCTTKKVARWATSCYAPKSSAGSVVTGIPPRLPPPAPCLPPKRTTSWACVPALAHWGSADTLLPLRLRLHEPDAEAQGHWRGRAGLAPRLPRLHQA